MKRLTRPLCAAAALLSLAACGPTSPTESPDTASNPATAAAAVSSPTSFKTAEFSPVVVEMDRFFYDDGSALSVRLRVQSGYIKGELAPIVLVSPDTGDLEVLTLSRSKDDPYLFVTEETLPVKVDASAGKLDGHLTAQKGELLYALYYPDYQAEPGLKGDAHVAFDVGAVPGTQKVNPPELLLELATEDELKVPVGGKRIGTLLEKDGLPLQVPLDELIVYPARPEDLKRFLARTGGQVVSDDRLSSQDVDAPTAYLVRVDASKVDTQRLPDLLAHTSFTSQLYASSEETLRLLALALELQLDGYQLSFNPKLQMTGAPEFRESGGTLAAGEHLFNPDFQVDKAWVRTAIFDADGRRSRVGIIDTGFAVNPDFRPSAGGTIPQCNVEGADFLDGLLRGVRCGPGAAEGAQTVGNSFFGGRTWHGNMIASTAGGVLNNGYGVAGVGGQVAEPVLYSMGLRSYAFEMGLAVKHMVDTQSPSVINISGGYPCQLLTRLGNFGICSTSDRALTCTAITAGLVSAAAVVCASAGLLAAIPVVGPFIAAPALVACGVATAAAATGTAACFSTLIAGDLKANMQGGIRRAMERGIPVVASASNRLNAADFQEPLRSLVRWDVTDTGQWDLIPCTLPDVICVGAANPGAAGHPNLHGNGAVVDFWAPIGPTYFAPVSDGTLEPAANHRVRGGGTGGGASAAAAYVSGLVALIQANDARLNPRTTTLTDRRVIPGQLRGLLQRTAHPGNAALGRGLLVNPRRAIEEASRSDVPDLAALGYDTLLNANEPLFDTEASARNLGTVAVGGAASASGAVHHIPGLSTTLPGVAGVTSLDEDWYRAAVPTTAGAYTLRVELRWLRRFGRPALTGEGLRAEGSLTTVGEEQVQVYATGLLVPGTARTFKVHAPGVSDDNVYKVRVTVTHSAGLQPDRFDLDDAALNPPESRPNNNTTARAPLFGFTRTDAFTDQFAWRYFYIPSPFGGAYTAYYNIYQGGLTLPEGDEDFFRVESLPYGTTAGTRACLFALAEPGVRVQVLQQQWIWTGSWWASLWMVVQEGDGQAKVRFASGATFSPLIIKASRMSTGELVEYDLNVRYFSNYAGCD